jgi:AcrR family transcriptional regulator
MIPDNPLRRRPQQPRGQRRIEAILDAAERVFAVVGYEATSTNQIAAEAHTSIGSLYQFFPNKEAILRALVARSQEQMRAVLDGVFASDPRDELSPDELLDRLLDPLITLYARGYRMLALFVALPRIGDGAQAGEPLVEEIIWRLDARLARRMPGLSPERRELSDDHRRGTGAPGGCHGTEADATRLHRGGDFSISAPNGPDWHRGISLRGPDICASASQCSSARARCGSWWCAAGSGCRYRAAGGGGSASP